MLNPEIHPLGLDGALVRFSNKLDEAANRAAIAFADMLRRADIASVREVASALTSVVVRFDPLELTYETLETRLSVELSGQDWSDCPPPQGRKLWRIPVALGGEAGPQFQEAADTASRSADELRQAISDARLKVLCLGFAPGQPYMGMMGPEWDIPRQTGLTPRVPAGALVMAVRQLIIYSGPAPTGWRQVGLSGFRPFQKDADNPIRMNAGDEVSFEVVSKDKLDGNGDGLGGATWEVLQ